MLNDPTLSGLPLLAALLTTFALGVATTIRVLREDARDFWRLIREETRDGA